MQFIFETVEVYIISSGAKGTDRACTDNWPIVIFDKNVKMQSIKYTIYTI